MDLKNFIKEVFALDLEPKERRSEKVDIITIPPDRAMSLAGDDVFHGMEVAPQRFIHESGTAILVYDMTEHIDDQVHMDVGRSYIVKVDVETSFDTYSPCIVNVPLPVQDLKKRNPAFEAMRKRLIEGYARAHKYLEMTDEQIAEIKKNREKIDSQIERGSAYLVQPGEPPTEIKPVVRGDSVTMEHVSQPAGYEGALGHRQKVYEFSKDDWNGSTVEGEVRMMQLGAVINKHRLLLENDPINHITRLVGSEYGSVLAELEEATGLKDKIKVYYRNTNWRNHDG
jgi:hypothetical protein